MESINTTTKNTKASNEVTSLQDIDKLFPENELPEKRYNSNTYEVSSLMMYLTGVPKKRFDEHVPELTKQYDTYDVDIEARIIRDLCIIRTALIKNFVYITNRLLYDMKSLSTLPEYIPPAAVQELEDNGIIFPGGKPDVNSYIVKINTEISSRINNVRSLFPEWIKWEYIRSLFIMPKGSNTKNIKAARDFYNKDRGRYPFQVWLNWGKDDCGNLFSNDYKFISKLYEANEDEFEDKSLISGTDSNLIVNLNDFIDQHKKVLVVVDCENSDPIKLAAALLSLDIEQISSICNIMLFDSADTTPAWKTLSNTGITKQFSTKRIEVPKLYEQKSQVDMALAVNVTREVFSNEVDAVILVSSDSDYWTLIKNIPEIDFLVMLEKMKSGNTIRDMLTGEGYQYCFIDDFCTSKAYSIKTDTILNAIQAKIDERVNFNLKDMLQEQAKISWLSLTDKESENLYDRYLKTMKLKIQSDGTVRLVIKE